MSGILKAILTAIAAGAVQALLQHFAPSAAVPAAGATAVAGLLMQSPIKKP